MADEVLFRETLRLRRGPVGQALLVAGCAAASLGVRAAAATTRWALVGTQRGLVAILIALVGVARRS